MKSAIVTLCLLIGILAIGCGSGDDSGAADAAGKAAEAAESAAKDVASDAETAVGDAAEAAGEAMDEAAESVEDNPVKRCLELAAEENWKDALGPCTEAAQEKPDDLSIKHALQQAQAAAKG